MSKNYYTLQELEKLQTWIERKLVSIPEDTKAGDDYSEANLSKSVLTFIQFLVEKELSGRCISPYMPDPHYYYPPYTTTTYTTTTTTNPQQTLTIDTSLETICSECKAKNPQNSICIHRVVLNTSGTTGE